MCFRIPSLLGSLVLALLSACDAARPGLTAPAPPSPSIAAATATVSVSGSGNGSGSVTSAPAGIQCAVTAGALGGTCWGNYTSGATVTLTPTPSPGSTFLGWTGACTGTGACVVTPSATTNVTATFITGTLVDVVVGGSGDGTGTVTSDLAGIQCTLINGTRNGTCGAQYTRGGVVTLTATPTGTNVFLGWTGACTGTGPCQIPLSAAANVTATFITSLEPLVVGAAGDGSGTVTSSLPGITCYVTAATLGGTCWAKYGHGTVVTVTAVPKPGSYFVGWTGQCYGTSPCPVTMDRPQTLIASFALLPSNVPNPPIDIYARSSGKVQNTVYWTIPGIGPRPTEVRVERRNPGGAFTQLGIVLSTANGFSDPTTTDGVVYEYRVRACNQVGCSAYSSVAWITHEYLGGVTGLLAVSVNGLPTGVAAPLAITGPNGFTATGSGPTNFTVANGTYMVSAGIVAAGSQTCAPSPASQSVSVVGAAPTTFTRVTVTYACR